MFLDWPQVETGVHGLAVVTPMHNLTAEMPARKIRAGIPLPRWAS
jgi:hypothetical protein